MKTLKILIAVAAALSVGAHAQTSAAPVQVVPTVTPAASMAEGEVRKVDKEAGKLTLRHGRIENLDMPPMTMVFRVADPKMLESVKQGDKVRFSADRAGGGFTVTSIELTK
jgi:Cu/Ag efflux protein CusF